MLLSINWGSLIPNNLFFKILKTILNFALYIPLSCKINFLQHTQVIYRTMQRKMYVSRKSSKRKEKIKAEQD